MVHFPELLQLRLFNGLCPDFRIIRGLVSELSLKLFCGLLWLVLWNFFLGIFMPQLVLRIKLSLLEFE